MAYIIWRRVHWARSGLCPTFNPPKTTFSQKKKNKKKLNPCHQMLFMGSKYAKIAFVAWAPPRTPLGELKRSLGPSSRNIGAYF